MSKVRCYKIMFKAGIGKIFSPELFFVLYYFSFTILRPILLSVGTGSTAVLIITVLLLVVLSLLSFKFRLNLHNLGKSVILIIFLSLLFCFDFLFRGNNFLVDYYYYFAVYGILAIFMMINITDYKRLLLYWVVCSSIVGVMYLTDPFSSYKWSGGYMPFGFDIMLPAFSGACVLFNLYKKRFALLLMIVFFIELVIFGNKGAIVAALLVFFFSSSYSKGNKRNTLNKYKFMYVFGFLLIFFYDIILNWFQDIASQLGVGSYALVSLSRILDKSNHDLFLGRSDLWNSVIDLIIDHPFIGYGIGTLEAITGNYAHNFLLDLLSTFGIPLGLIFLFVFCVFLVKNYKRSKDEHKYFIVIMGILGLSPLLFSLTFWKWLPFWVLIGSCLFKVRKVNYTRNRFGR